MLDVTSVNDLGLGVRQPETSEDRNDLGQEEFLTLMLEQLRNQDPLSPTESGDFLGQLAQFGTVTGIQDLQNSFNAFSESVFSDQALQASGLVGRNVLVPSEFSALDAENPTISGAVELPLSAPSVSLRVTDATGSLVRQIDLGANPQGLVNFTWDGLDDNGAPVPTGVYRFEAQGIQTGTVESIPVLLESQVDSVSFGGSQGVLLNVRGVGQLSLNEVLRIS